MSKLNEYEGALKLILQTGCMNEHYEGDMAIWCKDGKHSIYCPAGIAQSVLQPSVQVGSAVYGDCTYDKVCKKLLEECVGCEYNNPHSA